MAAKSTSAIWVCCAALSITTSLAAQDAPDLATIRGWIGQLDSEKFDEREEAAAKLMGAGGQAVDPISESIPGASRERLSRCLSILVTIALKGEGAAQDKAEAAVEAIASGADPRAARIAFGSLRTIQSQRLEQAREILVGLGAIVGEIRIEDLNGIWRLNDEDVGAVEIGPGFRGTIDDLKQLRRLLDVESITLNHPAANDQWLESIVEKMPQLQEVNIKRAKVTSAGLAALPKLKRLHHVWICYMPVDEKGLAELAKLPVVSYVTLFGTGVSKKQEEELNVGIPHAIVEVREGAFLGLGGEEETNGFRVRSVSPGSSAEKVGLKVGDTIQTVDGKPVATINDLTRVLRPVKPGAKILIEYLSGSEAKKVEVTLGEWP